MPIPIKITQQSVRIEQNFRNFTRLSFVNYFIFSYTFLSYIHFYGFTHDILHGDAVNDGIHLEILMQVLREDCGYTFVSDKTGPPAEILGRNALSYAIPIFMGKQFYI